MACRLCFGHVLCCITVCVYSQRHWENVAERFVGVKQAAFILEEMEHIAFEIRIVEEMGIFKVMCHVY